MGGELNLVLVAVQLEFVSLWSDETTQGPAGPWFPTPQQPSVGQVPITQGPEPQTLGQLSVCARGSAQLLRNHRL